jgi:soluble lytic murein transglycosylase-like protein
MVVLVPALIVGVAGCQEGPSRPGPAASSAAPTLPLDLGPLLAATRDATRAGAADLAPRLASSAAPAAEHPSWPIHTYLVGEVHRLRGEAAAARRAWRALAEWAAGDPYRDGRGGSCLGLVAVWRWLQAVDAESRPAADEAARLAEVSERLRSMAFARGLFGASALETLPQIEEEIAWGLARLAWSLGQREVAQRRFLDALGVARRVALGPAEEDLRQAVLASGLATVERLDLLRGQRLLALGRYDEAHTLLLAAERSADADVRSEARLHLARVEPIRDDKKKGIERDQVADRLAAVAEQARDPAIAERALYERAMLLVREGRGQNVGGFRTSMARLLEAFPRGRWADNAHYELGMQLLAAGELDRALEHFADLRAFPGENDWINSAYFRPALALYGRRGPGDLERATALLRELVAQQPEGPFRLAATFWLGRLAAQQGDEAGSAKAFRAVIAESPFDYHALRARMHLEAGERAATEVWPGPRTLTELREAWSASTAAPVMVGGTPYDRRVREAAESGLYKDAAEALRALRLRVADRRLEWLGLAELDEARLLPAIAVLVALRLDAVAGTAAPAPPEHRLAMAGTVGQRAGDWPLAMGLLIASGEPPATRAALQRSPHYLATAYPRVFVEAITRNAQTYRARPALLYSVIRNESLFNPAALSPAGALGLFQFTPPTFRAIVERHPALVAGGPATREAFLLDPARNIEMGALWFGRELVYRNHPTHALMEHNIGAGVVKAWLEGWRRIRPDDVEYEIDTIRANETHVFVRRVLTDAVLVEAGAVLGPAAGTGR